MATITKPLTVYLPDTRGVVVSPFGCGNFKIGPGVYTYSRLPGRPYKNALGWPMAQPTVDPVHDLRVGLRQSDLGGTCPGSSSECEKICYASRPVAEGGPVFQMWQLNSVTPDVPELPEDATLIRLHVSGDFDSVEYIENWRYRLQGRPDVTMWVYTRSWRVPELLPALELLRALPNVQMFASLDVSVKEMPPNTCKVCHLDESNEQHLAGCPDDCGAHDFVAWPWRRAWIDGDPRAGRIFNVVAHDAEGVAAFDEAFHLERTADGVKAVLCPEETGQAMNCTDCEFCFKGQRNDVVFLKH